MLSAFGPQDVQDWATGLGQSLFTGSTGRVFPEAMKASPLLRAWLGRLEGQGLTRRTRWRWTGWNGDTFTFDTPEGSETLAPAVTVLALGGASWARLGSDGFWTRQFREAGIALTPFAPANAGLDIHWSAHMTRHFGAPLKNVAFRAATLNSRGEAVVSARGLEGGGIYPLTPALREGAPLLLDLAPDLSETEVAKRIDQAGARQSLSNTLRKSLSLAPVAQALLQECARPLPRDGASLAALVKALEVPFAGLRPMDEAISTAGGVPFAALDDGLMLKNRPGVFCAGEMLDWEAPTGGYLLTACFATGLWAGRHAALYR